MLTTVVGDSELLTRPFVAFVCSVHCPADVILRTYDFARSIRDYRIPVIGGFHSPMEREFLSVLLRGSQPIIVCLARGPERFRLPREWQTAVEGRRLLVTSFAPVTAKRQNSRLAKRRNEQLSLLARATLVAHAAPGGMVEELCAKMLALEKSVYTFNCPANAHIVRLGAKPLDPSGISELAEAIGR